MRRFQAKSEVMEAESNMDIEVQEVIRWGTKILEELTKSREISCCISGVRLFLSKGDHVNTCITYKYIILHQ